MTDNLYLIDIARYQNLATIQGTKQNINWQTVKGQNDLWGVIIKATEGDNYVDPYFKYNRDNAGPLWPFLGMYAFVRSPAHGRGSIAAQAEHFCSTVGKLKDNEAVMLDIENAYDKNGNIIKPDVTMEEAVAFANIVEQRLGVRCLMYVGWYFNGFSSKINYVLNGGLRPWVLPWYGTNNGIPNGATEAKVLKLAPQYGPALWQFCSQKRPVNGISGDVDWNKVYDTEILLGNTAGGNKVVTPPPTENPKPPIIRNHAKDTDMAKIISVEEDGQQDNAVYAVSGQCATWISTEAEFAKLGELGVIPGWDKLERVSREDLKVFVLVSAGPSYADDYTGIKTSGEDFRATA